MIKYIIDFGGWVGIHGWMYCSLSAGALSGVPGFCGFCLSERAGGCAGGRAGGRMGGREAGEVMSFDPGPCTQTRFFFT